MKTTKSALLVGVGGQGAILTAKVLVSGLMKAGYDVKMSEVHGMSQRGGSVSTQVHWGEKVYSPVIGKGAADIVVAFEKMEAVRYADYLKPDGVAVINDYEMASSSIAAGLCQYPEGCLEAMEKRFRCYVLKAGEIAQGLGSAKCMNIVLFGSMVKALGMDDIDWEAVIGETVPEKFRDLNLRAYRAGRDAVSGRVAGMLKDFQALREKVGTAAPRTVAVACAHDGHTLEAVLRAAEEGILRYVLVGRRDDILKIGQELGHSISDGDIIPAETDEEAARLAVQLVREGKADFLQKGLMQTSTILKAVVNKETGIGLGRPMSHTALLEIPGYHKLLGVADGGMIPAPDLEAKKAILHNAVELFRRLGYDRPMVSAVCAAETVSPKIIETVDAAALKEAAQAGDFGPCYVEGPISLDLALDKSSAEIKGYESPVCGETDILLVPTMAAGNMTVKSLLTFAGARMVGVVTGAKCPIALNSRSASFEEKYNSLLACALAGGQQEANHGI